VQVDPIKPKLIPPGTKRLNIQSDEPLSNFAFNFNLRRCNQEYPVTVTYDDDGVGRCTSSLSIRC
jgi:hypothetical protein